MPSLSNIEAITNANRELTVAPLQYFSEQSPKDNIFVSPISLYLGLAMAYLGFGGDTKHQLAATLGLDTMADDEAIKRLSRIDCRPSASI